MNYDEVPGWFAPIDQAAFGWILAFQNRSDRAGGLVELGVFKGKSAITLGNHLRAGEVLTVCDLFEDVAASDQLDGPEQRFLASQDLSQAAFERIYLAFHADLPRIVRAPSAQITRHVAPQTARFVHVDAGHGYERVREDIASARVMLHETGVVAINDYRKAETPGVAAATWEAILIDGLKPFVVTQNKLYATWGDPDPLRAEVARRVGEADWCALRTGLLVRDLPVDYLHRKG